MSEHTSFHSCPDDHPEHDVHIHTAEEIQGELAEYVKAMKKAVRFFEDDSGQALAVLSYAALGLLDKAQFHAHHSAYVPDSPDDDHGKRVWVVRGAAFDHLGRIRSLDLDEFGIMAMLLEPDEAE